MLKALRKRATYANVAMTLALVFAMTGGAYAAKKYLITSTKQISPTVLKRLQGKTGRAGAAGPQGPTGPAGSAGVKGENGANGKDGKDGAQGPAGPQGPTGATGPKGAAGSPWTVGTLPGGKTETGVWAMGHIAENEAYPGVGLGVNVPVSFNVPLAGGMKQQQVHIILANGEELTEQFAEAKSTKCLGSASQPTAEPGNLCFYTGVAKATIIYYGSYGNPATGAYGSAGENIEVVSPAGIDLTVQVQGAGAEASGTWAVTAE